MDIIPFEPNEPVQPLDATPPKISKHACVDAAAEIGPGVEIGPFCVIGPKAKIGPGCKLMNNVTMLGDVTLGHSNIVSPGAVLGGAPQDISYKGSETKVCLLYTSPSPRDRG